MGQYNLGQPLSLIGAIRDILGNPYKLGQYKMGQVNKRLLQSCLFNVLIITILQNTKNKYNCLFFQP